MTFAGTQIRLHEPIRDTRGTVACQGISLGGSHHFRRRLRHEQLMPRLNHHRHCRQAVSARVCHWAEYCSVEQTYSIVACQRTTQKTAALFSRSYPSATRMEICSPTPKPNSRVCPAKTKRPSEISAALETEPQMQATDGLRPD